MDKRRDDDVGDDTPTLKSGWSVMSQDQYYIIVLSPSSSSRKDSGSTFPNTCVSVVIAIFHIVSAHLQIHLDVMVRSAQTQLTNIGDACPFTYF